MQKLLYFIRKSAVAVVFVVLEIIAIHCYAYSTPYTQARLLVWTNSVVGYVHSIFAGVSSYFALREENARLTEHIVLLENRIKAIEEFIPEDKVIVDGVLKKYDYLSANVIASTTNRSRNFITINKGYRDGVSADMAVMTPDGAAVGVIVECTDNFAVAQTLLNVDFRVSGVLARDGSNGSVVWGGDDIQMVDFVEVSKYADAQKGDMIYAAGFSQIFPKEAVIGHVESVELANNGASYNCKVRLVADMSRLYNVVLVRNTNFGEMQQLENSTNQ